MNKLIGGLDEVGLGALAGPIIIATTAFRVTLNKPKGCEDSKKLSQLQRTKMAQTLVEELAFLGVGWASVKEINQLGVAEAWQLAAARSLEKCPKLEMLVVDGERPVQNYDSSQKVEPKADQHWWQCSAASIIAKVVRDTEMRALDKYYPQYEWLSNVGYGSKSHRQAIHKHGPCPEHREQFIKNLKT